MDEKIASQISSFIDHEILRIKKNISLKEEIKITITILSSDSEIKKISGFPDWGVGCAMPSKREIIIKSPRIIKYPLNLKNLLIHEITHVVLGNKYKNISIPKWFDEGIAMYEAREWRMSDNIKLAWANFTHSILPLSSIERKFPEDKRRADLAYIESFSVIPFIVCNFGKEKIKELINNIEKTNSFEKGIRETFGINYLDFMIEWKKWVQERYSHFSIIFSLFPISILLLIFFIAVLLKTKFNKKRQENLEF
jgi:hypothetical protein